MSTEQTHPGSPVDSLESRGAAGRSRQDAGATESGGSAGAGEAAECGTAAACGACSLAGAGGCGPVPDGVSPVEGAGSVAQGAEPTAPVGCGASAQASQTTQTTWRDGVSRRLSVLPPAAIAPIVVGLVVVGLLITGVFGGVLLAIGVATLSGLFALTWPRLTAPEKALRVAVLVFVLGLAVIRFVPN